MTTGPRNDQTQLIHQNNAKRKTRDLWQLCTDFACPNYIKETNMLLHKPPSTKIRLEAHFLKYPVCFVCILFLVQIIIFQFFD